METRETKEANVFTTGGSRSHLNMPAILHYHRVSIKASAEEGFCRGMIQDATGTFPAADSNRSSMRILQKQKKGA